jgi:hypothetical protein
VPKQALIEARVIAAVEAVLDGKEIEDERIECKSELMDPANVRQLAGAANSAMGDDLIWIIGLNEKTNKLVPLSSAIDMADWWSKVERSFDGGIAPLLTSFRVPVSGGDVLTLHFSTDRAPYVVKAPGGGSPELEVPWRAGTRTRSAKRHELLRLLLPTVHVPDVTLIECSAQIYEIVGRLRFDAVVEFYLEHIQGGLVALPAHKMTGDLEISETEYKAVVAPHLAYVSSGHLEVRHDGL